MTRDSDEWAEGDVVNVKGAEFIFRTYIEHSELRRYLLRIATKTQLVRACDVGAGYGRMSLVLKEVCDSVVAFEREPTFLEKGSYLLPTVQYREIESLDMLPARDNEFDFALAFTVIQHLPDPLASATLNEVCRIVRPEGYVLLCEETDYSHDSSTISDPHPRFFIRRSVEQYQQWMTPFYLVETSPRIIERGYFRGDVGQYLLFRAPL
ncbi:MAG: class I SAM-dependent methyltransferase [Acidobacteria bacterium]|nr:class I SAM-dependent methyltransferase [Acidobacteriota bacterium]